MRKFLTLALVVGVLGSVGFVRDASATPQLQLQWTSSSIVSPGDPAFMNVILVVDAPLAAATVMVELVDKSAGAPKITAGATLAPPQSGSVQFNITPAAPNGDTIGAFGGLSLTAIPIGTYTIGNISFVAGATTGDFLIQAFQRPGIDDWLDASAINVIIPVLHNETLNVIPEPGTAALLGLGLVGLIAVGRRSRS